MATFGEYHRHIDMCKDDNWPGLCDLMELMWKYGLDKWRITSHVNKICPETSNDDSDDSEYANVDKDREFGDIPGICELMDIMWKHGLERYKILSYFMDINIDVYLELSKPLFCKPL